MQKIVVEVEHNITQKCQEAPEKQTKQTETMSCRLELEKCVCNQKELCASSQNRSTRIYLERRRKSLDEEVSSFEEIFSNRVTKAVFARGTLKHKSKAYKHPDDDVPK